MILTAHQPAYLPWLGLFHKIALADKFILFDDVQYVPRDWISRNQIKTQGGPLMLTVPMLTTGHREKVIAEMEINNEVPWKRKHWKAMLLAYQSAPHFKQYADFFEDLYSKEWKLLADLNLYTLEWILKTLKIQVPVERAHTQHFQGSKSDLVLDMCLKHNAQTYIFGELGQDYADTEKFKSQGVVPFFQIYKHPVYKQLHGNFASHMSIVDLLFNEGDRSLDIIMSGNVAKEEVMARAMGGVGNDELFTRVERTL